MYQSSLYHCLLIVRDLSHTCSSVCNSHKPFVETEYMLYRCAISCLLQLWCSWQYCTVPYSNTKSSSEQLNLGPVMHCGVPVEQSSPVRDFGFQPIALIPLLLCSSVTIVSCDSCLATLMISEGYTFGYSSSLLPSYRHYNYCTVQYCSCIEHKNLKKTVTLAVRGGALPSSAHDWPRLGLS
jgi:hypothetical protein